MLCTKNDLFFSTFSTIIFFQLGCTTWIDKDDPSGNCDCENLFNQTRMDEVRNLMSSCETSNYVIQARLKGGKNIYENTEQALADTENTINFVYKPLSANKSEFAKIGVYCWNNKNVQPVCKDFGVRYCCSKSISIYY